MLLSNRIRDNDAAPWVLAEIKMLEARLSNACPQRMWVNQPSQFHTYNQYHGRNVLAMPEGESVKTLRVFFLEGDTVSQMMLAAALSPGWTTDADPQEDDDKGDGQRLFEIWRREWKRAGGGEVAIWDQIADVYRPMWDAIATKFMRRRAQDDRTKELFMEAFHVVRHHVKETDEGDLCCSPKLVDDMQTLATRRGWMP